MRDMNRIPTILQEIKDEWNKVPDWRFCQLMTNFFSWYGRDPFFMEDDKFIEKFKEFMQSETA